MTPPDATSICPDCGATYFAVHVCAAADAPRPGYLARRLMELEAQVKVLTAENRRLRQRLADSTTAISGRRARAYKEAYERAYEQRVHGEERDGLG